MEHSIFKEPEKKKIEIILLGQRLALRSDRDEEYLQSLAHFVTNQIEDVRKGTRAISSHQTVLLVCLRLADRLKQTEEELERVRSLIRDKAGHVLKDVESALFELKKNNYNFEDTP